MHRQKILAQILLMLSILNSVLAAPAVSARGIHEARRALAVRVPSAERVEDVLQKRPEQELDTLRTNVVARLILEELPQEDPHLQYSRPQQSAIQPLSAYEQSGIRPTPPPEPKPAEVSSGVPSKAPSSIPAWKEKIMTPQKIKALGFVGLAGLATSAYLSLLLPEIFNGQSQNSQKNNGQDGQQ